MSAAPSRRPSFVTLAPASLSWCDAQRSDLPDLQVFQCRAPVKVQAFNRRTPRRFSPDLEAQSAIRSLRLGKSTIRLGHDPAGLAAVVAYAADWRQGYVFLQVIGRAHRCQGSGLGDLCMQEFVDDIIRRAALEDVGSLRLECKVRPDNRQSLALLERWSWGFSAENAHHQLWVADLSW